MAVGEGGGGGKILPFAAGRIGRQTGRSAAERSGTRDFVGTTLRPKPNLSLLILYDTFHNIYGSTLSNQRLLDQHQILIQAELADRELLPSASLSSS